MSELRYAEDIPVGEVWELGADRLSVEDIVSFATQWDPQEYHTDPDAEGTKRFGGLIASGLQSIAVLARASIPVFRTWHLVAGRMYRRIDFLGPVRPDTTLHCSTMVESIDFHSPHRARVNQVQWLKDDDGAELVVARPVIVVLRRPEGDR